ncbi:MAG: hypothetical protein LC731_05280, partial [Acidobacteria bacterium]|nr:hypothetical protein [Acidobacteriota bacterium]
MKTRLFLPALIAVIVLTLTITHPAHKATAARMVAPSAEPEIRLLEYNGMDYAADVKVGTSYIIEVVNNTGGNIWWIKRSKVGGYKVLLLPNEGIKIQRRISRENWMEATDEYATLID